MKSRPLRVKIGSELAISGSQLHRLFLRAPHTYKVYTIPKKTGGKRVIAQPARETKYIQNWLIQNIFCELPIHKNATAYKEGASIKKNASAHLKNSYLVKFDFKHFFTSIKEEDLLLHFKQHLKNFLLEDEMQDAARACCIQHKPGKKLCLSIGAPSSPILSNSIMFEFDDVISKWTKKNNMKYTRYADDLTFSTNEKGACSKVERQIRDTIRSLGYPNLRINNKKTIHLSKKTQRRITGIVVTNEKRLSIGRGKKRQISALIHRYTLKKLEENEICQLQGLLGFSRDVEPEFIDKMRIKYGSLTISSILKYRKED